MQSEVPVNNGVPTDLVAFLVGIACGLVLGCVFGRALRERRTTAPPTPWWRQPDSPLAQRLRGFSDAEEN